MVHRIFVEKRAGLAPEAEGMLATCRSFLGIDTIKSVRIINRYDIEGIDDELFEYAKRTVLGEPQLDMVYEAPIVEGASAIFAVEALPGQFDQRADSAAQCIQLLSAGERPDVRTAKLYVLYGDVSESDIERIKRFVINPVESREASLALPETLKQHYEMPDSVETVTGFIGMDETELKALLERLALAMDIDDLMCLQEYFRDTEHRDPTITEIRVVDTYWSDHCRHTTFSTHIDEVEIDDPEIRRSYEDYLRLREEVYGADAAANRPQTLMDLATIGTKALKRRGELPELDESEEINACSIRETIDVDGQPQEWLLMFKNETHNHPTEIEPFGGAATCIGGCIRDPLSGRAYVHQAMRVTGGGDPRKSLADTLPGKLPQRQIAQTAAAGYSSYGNQIGLATGHVAEVYHEDYIAKRLECGVVVGAAPRENVVRETPAPGDVVILLGGRTGRDGIGGATGSSKSHDAKSLQTMASEVQKGNAPEERKIQRLFRDGEVTRLIKRCNDFGAGGVSVAIGELADGLAIDLDAVRKKYEGLDGTELAISESQERMAVVVAPQDEERFIQAAAAENLEAYRVAVVTAEPRMVMTWRGRKIADLSREFLSSNGAVKHARVKVEKACTDVESGVGESTDKSCTDESIGKVNSNNTSDQAGTCDRSKGAVKAPRAYKLPFSDLRSMAQSLKTASRRGLAERFDGTIGAGSVLAKFGGSTGRSPEQAMAALFPVLPGQHTDSASVMSWGFDPDMSSFDPYEGSHAAVYTSVAKIVASGADYRKAYLTMQEFFEKLRDDPRRWGKPFASLLGALDAQIELGTAAIGGKDSMSGSFNDIDVPPTLISFAIAPLRADEVISSAFAGAGHPVYLLGYEGDPASVKEGFELLHELAERGKVLSARAVEHGIAEGIMDMAFGEGLGFMQAAQHVDYYTPMPGAIIVELTEDVTSAAGSGTSSLPILLGTTTCDGMISISGESVSIEELYRINEGVLEEVYPVRTAETGRTQTFSYEADGHRTCGIITARPKVLIPVFPGTNCEYDTARAFMDAGADAQILVIRNHSSEDVAASVEAAARAIGQSQMIAIPGGFSGGDEPDGSAKFITAFFRNPDVKDAVTRLLAERDGLMLGICNGFQALIKLGLVPYGRIIDTDADCPTLTYNTIGRHQSRLVRTRIASNMSPWLRYVKTGEIYTVPVSHGEGRFIASEELIRHLASDGQIAAQYVDRDGEASMETDYNPNGSMYAIEAITSPDGRVLGKMGHSERKANALYRNVPGEYDMKIFEAAVTYFRGI